MNILNKTRWINKDGNKIKYFWPFKLKPCRNNQKHNFIDQKRIKKSKPITFGFIIKSVSENFLLSVGCILQYFLSAWMWCCINDPLLAWIILIFVIITYSHIFKIFSEIEREQQERSIYSSPRDPDISSTTSGNILEVNGEYQEINHLNNFMQNYEKKFSRNINELLDKIERINEENKENDVQQQLDIIEEKVNKNENLLEKLERSLQIETECRNILIQTIIHKMSDYEDKVHKLKDYLSSQIRDVNKTSNLLVSLKHQNTLTEIPSQDINELKTLPKVTSNNDCYALNRRHSSPIKPIKINAAHNKINSPNDFRRRSLIRAASSNYDAFVSWIKRHQKIKYGKLK